MEDFKERMENLYQEAKNKGIDCIICCSKDNNKIYKEHIESQVRFCLTEMILERTEDPLECLLISMTNKRIIERFLKKDTKEAAEED